MKVRVFTKSRTALGVVLGIGLAAGCAFAAWAIYTGLTGSAHGQYGTAPTLNALTFADDTLGGETPVSVVPCTSGTGSSCTGGTEGVIAYQVANANPASENWLTPGVTFASSDTTDNCAGHLFLAPDNVFPASFSGGSTTDYALRYVSDSTTPPGCSNATITATFTGTTQP